MLPEVIPRADTKRSGGDTIPPDWLDRRRIVDMAETTSTRSARLAEQFSTAQEDFIRLVESLTEAQWRMNGKNNPQFRLNDEDEERPLGVIAHHVATSGNWIMERIQAIVVGAPTPPVDFRAVNARHAVEHAGVTKDEVLTLLRGSSTRIAAAVRAIPDEKLDLERPIPSGVMTVQQRIERVLIGHVQSHQGSIEATIA
jgi:hypothetical protein